VERPEPAQRSLIGVMPAEALADRARLFSALEQAHPLRFVAREPGATIGLDAAIVFPPSEAAAGDPLPRLVFAGQSPRSPGATTVSFSDATELDRRLRGQRLVEEHAPALAETGATSGDQVLASYLDTPAWIRRGSVQMAAGAPEELEPGETLRSRLRAGRFMELLPLVHFLREQVTTGEWDQPPLRACLVFDDPNLRSKSYGHIRYRELASHARRHGYHASMASIPLDYRVIDRDAAALFRENAAHLSIAIHGNNHERMELLRTQDDGAAAALAAQALRRTARFESRFGLRVCRVMCPPHEVCGEAMMRAMFRLGFEAVTIEPLLFHQPENSWGTSLDGFEPARTGGGLPVIPRYPLAADLDDLPLRAFLNLPMVVYGHHRDVQDGLDAVLPLVERIAALGPVSWMPLSSIARSNYLASRNGGELRVRLHSVLADVSVPEGVEALHVELPAVSIGPAEELKVWFEGRSVPIQSGAEQTAYVVLPLKAAGSTTARIEVASGRRQPFEQVAAPGRRIWPVLRRATTEARDRAAPLRHRISRVLRPLPGPRGEAGRGA
jgi:hypothetical protein